MFIYSSDKAIKAQQEIDDNKTQCLIGKYVNIEHSPEIENFFDVNCNSISYLVDFSKIIKNNGFHIIIPCIDRSENSTTVKREIENGFKITSKYSYDHIPFIRFTFMEVQVLHGVFLQELYMLFFNKHNKFKDSADATMHYLNKFNKMKVFM